MFTLLLESFENIVAKEEIAPEADVKTNIYGVKG